MAENGEIVVALVGEEATVKTFYKEEGHFRLQPENHTMAPIIVDRRISSARSSPCCETTNNSALQKRLPAGQTLFCGVGRGLSQREAGASMQLAKKPPEEPAAAIENKKICQNPAGTLPHSPKKDYNKSVWDLKDRPSGEPAGAQKKGDAYFG